MALYLLLEYTQSAEQCGQDADVQVGGAENLDLYEGVISTKADG